MIDPGSQHQPYLADHLAPEMESIGRRPKIEDRQIRPRMVGRSGHHLHLLAAALRSTDGRSCAALLRYRCGGSRKISWLDPVTRSVGLRHAVLDWPKPPMISPAALKSSPVRRARTR